MRAALSLVLLAFGCTERVDPGADGSAADGGPGAFDASFRDVTPLDLPDGGDAAVPPLDSDIVAFCIDLGASLCAALDECGCTFTTDGTCPMTFRSACELDLFTPDVRRALADGRLVFDGAAASRMIAALEAPNVCSVRSLEPWTIRDYYTFGGVLEGTKHGGDACTAFTDTTGYAYAQYFHIDECADGVCDARRCIEFEGVGGTCDTDHVCTDLDAPVRFSWDIRQKDLPCMRSSPDATSGICGAKRPGGALCDRASDCESYRCESGLCVALGDIGASCNYPQHCRSGFCPATGQCAAGNLLPGSTCTYSGYECASGYCSWMPDGTESCESSICGVARYYGLQGLFPR